MRKYLFEKVIWTAFIYIFLSNFSFAESIDSLQNVLSEEIKNKEKYEVQKKNRLQAIHDILKNPSLNLEERFRYNQAIVKEYEKYSFDSTMHYLQENIKIAQDLQDDKLLNQTYLSLGSNLQNVGKSKEAEDVLLKIVAAQLDFSGLIRLRNSQRKLYENLSFYSSTDEYWWRYKEKYDYFKDRLLKMLDEDSEILLDIKEKDLLDERKLDESLKINSLRLSKTEMGMPQYSLITFQRSLIYQLKMDSVQRKKYLILSAISDIRANVKDNASLAALASILYEEGNVELAYFYIQSAYEDAIQFNSGLRFDEISKTLAPIAKSFEKLTNAQQNRMKVYLKVISLLVVVLLIISIIIFRQNNKLSVARNELKYSLEKLNDYNTQIKKANNKLKHLYDDLSESNIVKEHYIANFLNIHSEFIDKLDKYQNLVKKNLVSRNFEKLISQINSRQFIDAEIQYFYTIFDESFLAIYPDFISQLNSLLRADEKIVLKEGELLNTELRIFALIRLGITDSSTISRLLRYSVNTIYNYRVKIKNKSKVARDDFEELVKKIDSFQARI